MTAEEFVSQFYKDAIEKGSELFAELDVKRRWQGGPSKAGELEAEIQSLKRSVSWRVTRPVRMVGSLLRRWGMR